MKNSPEDILLDVLQRRTKEGEMTLSKEFDVLISLISSSFPQDERFVKHNICIHWAATKKGNDIVFGNFDFVDNDFEGCLRLIRESSLIADKSVDIKISYLYPDNIPYKPYTPKEPTNGLPF